MAYAGFRFTWICHSGHCLSVSGVLFAYDVFKARLLTTIRYYILGVLFIALITDPIAYASLPNYGISSAALLGKNISPDTEFVASMKWPYVFSYYHEVPIQTNTQQNYYLLDDSQIDQRSLFTACGTMTPIKRFSRYWILHS